MSLRLPALALAVLAASATAGCVARVQPAPAVVVASSDVEYVPPPPIVVESHPYVIYRGAPVYWVEGRWYRRTSHGWVYYRTEPPALVRYRYRAHVHVR